MPNQQKIETVAELRDLFANSKGAILTEYRGLTVAEVTRLRRKLREVDAEYHVVKNTLFKLALGDALTPELESLLVGPTAIAFAKGDIVPSSKAVIDFLREVRNKPEVVIKGGYLDGKIYSTEQVTAISKLPPKEQVISQLVSTLNGPVSNLVGTLDNIIGEFVRTIQAIADKQGGTPASA